MDLTVYRRTTKPILALTSAEHSVDLSTRSHEDRKTKHSHDHRKHKIIAKIFSKKHPSTKKYSNRSHHRKSKKETQRLSSSSSSDSTSSQSEDRYDKPVKRRDVPQSYLLPDEKRFASHRDVNNRYWSPTYGRVHTPHTTGHTSSRSHPKVQESSRHSTHATTHKSDRQTMKSYAATKGSDHKSSYYVKGREKSEAKVHGKSLRAEEKEKFAKIPSRTDHKRNYRTTHGSKTRTGSEAYHSYSPERSEINRDLALRQNSKLYRAEPKSKSSETRAHLAPRVRSEVTGVLAAPVGVDSGYGNQAREGAQIIPQRFHRDFVDESLDVNHNIIPETRRPDVQIGTSIQSPGRDLSQRNPAVDIDQHRIGVNLELTPPIAPQMPDFIIERGGRFALRSTSPRNSGTQQLERNPTSETDPRDIIEETGHYFAQSSLEAQASVDRSWLEESPREMYFDQRYHFGDTRREGRGTRDYMREFRFRESRGRQSDRLGLDESTLVRRYWDELKDWHNRSGH